MRGFVGSVLCVAALALNCLVGSAAQAQSVSRGPYLQQGAPNSVIVRWRTSASTGTVVRYGLSAANLNQTTTISGSRTEHVVPLSNLTPATRYYYSIGNSGGALAGGDSSTFFETSPAVGSTNPVRIWAIGDSGSANANAQSVYNAYRSLAGSTYTDLWLMLGDNAYNDGTDSEYQAAVFEMYPELLRQTPVWPTLGNHDGHSADSASESGPYYDIFSLPRQGEVGGVASGTEAYYAFNYANIHFVVLDSYESSRSTAGAMLTWLQQDLQAASADWLVAFWHHPPYTKGSHNSDTEGALIDMRENALPILESYGVDLVLSGHSHSYERSFLLDGHYGISGTLTGNMVVDGGDGRSDGDGAYTKATEGLASHEGAVYVVAGASGKTSGGSLNHPAMYISLNQLGSLVIDVDGFTMDVRYLSGGGNVTDYFTLVKGDGSACQVTESPESSCSDGVDNDCDGVADGTDTDCCPDSDGDGHSSASCGGTDCDDANGNVFPGAAEVCGDSTDNNCNGYTDCADSECGGHVACCADADGDGFTDPSCGGNDCDDSSSSNYPGATELCADDVDNNCNGFTDCAESSCAGVGSCPAAPRMVFLTGIDDAHVQANNPDTNYGAASALLVDTSSVFMHAFIKPQSLADIQPGSQVVSAQLVVNVFDGGDDPSLREVLEDWDESSISYNNSPSTGPNLESFAGGAGERAVDVTALVQAWVNGQPIYGVNLYPSGSNGVDIRSSEYGTSAERPYFVVEILEAGSSTSCADADGDTYSDATCGGDDCNDSNANVSPAASELCGDGVDNDCNGAADCNDSACSADALCTGGTGEARTVVLTAVDDVYVRSNSTGSNYGSATSLQIDTAGTFKMAYVKPNGLADIASGAQVVSAELVLTVYNVGDTVQVREVTSAWTEGGVTYSSVPSVDTNVLGTFSPSSSGEYTVDITALAQSWVNGGALYGVQLYPTDRNGVDIRSSEYGDSTQRPHFVLQVIE